MKAIKAAYDAFVAALDLWAAELRTGVTLIEAVKSQELDAELRAVGVTDNSLKEAAITLAKFGISGDDDIHKMVHYWNSGRIRWMKLAAEAERYANE